MKIGLRRMLYNKEYEVKNYAYLTIVVQSKDFTNVVSQNGYACSNQDFWATSNTMCS